MDVLTNSTLLAIQNMVNYPSPNIPAPPTDSLNFKTWNGMMGFQSGPNKWQDIDITLPDLEYQDLFEQTGLGGLDRYQGIMGKQHYERGLMFTETYLSGHM